MRKTARFEEHVISLDARKFAECVQAHQDSQAKLLEIFTTHFDDIILAQERGLRASAFSWVLGAFSQHHEELLKGLKAHFDEVILCVETNMRAPHFSFLIDACPQQHHAILLQILRDYFDKIVMDANYRARALKSVLLSFSAEQQPALLKIFIDLFDKIVLVGEAHAFNFLFVAESFSKPHQAVLLEIFKKRFDEILAPEGCHLRATEFGMVVYSFSEDFQEDFLEILREHLSSVLWKCPIRERAYAFRQLVAAFSQKKSALLEIFLEHYEAIFYMGDPEFNWRFDFTEITQAFSKTLHNILLDDRDRFFASLPTDPAQRREFLKQWFLQAKEFSESAKTASEPKQQAFFQLPKEPKEPNLVESAKENNLPEPT